ncbi:MAG TPA: glycosyl hydrolase family 65 protein [Chthonomonadaceae bacterium]|nr:glycosyl hydrolase family 65 protein [Chthonomonadaceae bacterium]
MRFRLFFLLALCGFPGLAAWGQEPTAPPPDFPHFSVPGEEKALDSLRALYWLTYPGAGPKATLWDKWLCGPALWPAYTTDNFLQRMRADWAQALSDRIEDPEGYVATMQHPSIAHPLGWPFPFWNQGAGGAGWHFSFKNTAGPPWRTTRLSTPEGWSLDGAESAGVDEWGWNLKLTQPQATVTTPEQKIDTFQAPFLQLRWRAAGLGNARPFVEWATTENPAFGPDRRFYFAPVEGSDMVYTALPLFKHPKWTGEITRLRIGFGNAQPGAQVTIQALFTQYDTRHDVNNQSFLLGCAAYFDWTGDINFLRRNIDRMRLALRYVMTDLHAEKEHYVLTLWPGHDAISGLQRDAQGHKRLRYGHGIGSNYWDLLPFGYKDAYATVQYYAALQAMIDIERAILRHPEWNVPGGALALDPDRLERDAAEVKQTGNRLFWNPRTGRFVSGIDAEGQSHDYGFTFLNEEAIACDFASPPHAKAILDWIDGKRTVPGDTSQGADIYHWRFAPRSTTRRNIDYYGWFWSNPEGIPWGGQVQDGGAVLGFSYYDLMARLKVLGPEDAWQRLGEIATWFAEVQAAGGYRAYYNGTHAGTLQGGGKAGGLGVDKEFFESVLVPQALLDGFLGFTPLADGFSLSPRLPVRWPSLTIDRIAWHDLTLSIRATQNSIEIHKEGQTDEPAFVRLPQGHWQVTYLAADGTTLFSETPVGRPEDGAFPLHWTGATAVRFDLSGK